MNISGLSVRAGMEYNMSAPMSEQFQSKISQLGTSSKIFDLVTKMQDLKQEARDIQWKLKDTERAVKDELIKSGNFEALAINYSYLRRMNRKTC